MALTSWPWLVGGAMSGLLAYANLPSSWILPQERMTADHLAGARLTHIPGGSPVASAASLWSDTGAVVMAVRRPG